jgi:GT2 family glycosyltransferase
MNKKISIVTSYYNRRKLFYNTLKTIEHSKYKNEIEIVVIDDASDENERLDDFPILFNLDIKITRIDKEDKWWMNPCIPFNIGFKKSIGDIIIVQNPECLHMNDIIEYTLNNIKKNTYLNFACYSIDKSKTDLINNINFNNINYTDKILKIITPFNNNLIHLDGICGWYNHSVYRPHKLHFCSAITKKDLEDIGGFDERFADGIGYDDNAFLLDIQNKGMNIELIDNPFVIHQYHTITPYAKLEKYVSINKELLNIKNKKNK